MMGEEDDAVTSNAMNNNDDCTTNIPSCSGSDNNRIGDRNCDINQISQVWGTLEELLLTCAVERHGSRDWDSVAKEVGSRSSVDASAINCKLKYQDLKRRFEDSVDDDDGKENSDAVAEEDRDGDIPWLEQLRSLRMAELRREIQRRDDSILSRQLKVQKLTEEREGNDADNKPDLEDDDAKAVRSPRRLNRETTTSDHRSMNESNSTTSVDKIADHDRLGGDKTVQANESSRNSDPDPAHKATAAEEEELTVSKRSDISHSGELGESGTSTGHRKRKGQIYRSGEDSCIRGGSGGDIKTTGNKSQPLIEIIKLIRSHPRGSVFESPLRSQETNDYKRLVRQHMDIKTIEKKMEKGSYVSSTLSFYRDLKLLFTNAIVFFPTSSSESMAAQELRALVSNEMKKETGHRVVKTEAESSGSRQKPSAPPLPPPPLVVCKKKSTASKKTVTSSSSLKQKDEKKTEEVSEEKKTVTTASRSSRRTSNVGSKDFKTGRTKNNNKKQKSDDDEEETHKKEKLASEKKKSVAEFLKRIKKNSPQKGKETTTTSKDQKKKSDGNVKKEAKPRELRSNSTGKKKAEVEDKGNKSSSKRKQSKKEAEEVTTVAATGSKRGRESAGKDNQQPKKRSRR